MSTSNSTASLATTTPSVVRPLPTTSVAAARLAYRASVAFLVLLAALHLLKPELDPSWRFVSEYSIGRHGWVMVLAFLCLATSCTGLFVAIRSHIHTTAGKVGLGLLLLVAAALAAGGVFVMDPITASKDELTLHGNVHGFAAMIGIPSLPFAALLISHSLLHNTAWTSERRALRVTAHLTWISLVLMFTTLGITLAQSGGQFGPSVVIGWPNRLVVIAYAAWLIVVSRRATRFTSNQPRA